MYKKIMALVTSTPPHHPKYKKTSSSLVQPLISLDGLLRYLADWILNEISSWSCIMCPLTCDKYYNRRIQRYRNLIFCY